MNRLAGCKGTYRIYLVTEHETFDTSIQKTKRKWKYSSAQFTNGLRI